MNHETEKNLIATIPLRFSKKNPDNDNIDNCITDIFKK